MKKLLFDNKKVLVMGLGLHGGGVETIRYLLRHGAQVICTDLRNEEELRPSIEAVKHPALRFVLGKHDAKDFDEADIIVKNPAVPANSPFLVGRTNIETDITLFLQSTDASIIAVTGSKGKSTVVSILYHILRMEHPETQLGGNITVSPLSFLENLSPNAPVILELSSWQLADLASCSLLQPKISCITNLMKDHQNRYASFSDYEKDKMLIFENSTPNDWCVFPANSFGDKWAAQTDAKTLFIAEKEYRGKQNAAWLDKEGFGWLRKDGTTEKIVPASLQVPGLPFRQNALFAASMARLWGCKTAQIHKALTTFHGVPYRMEKFLVRNGVTFYDDTTATIPEATAAAVKAFSCPLLLIAGGTNKALDFEPFDTVAKIPKRILMLSGTATDIWLPRLQELGVQVEGPFENMETAVERAKTLARSGDAVILSPGATSFGMFRHEFERGDIFKEACRK